MNLLFQTAKPRRFSHTMVYCDERRERLRRLEAQARRELDMDAGPQADGRVSSQSDDDLRPTLRLQFGVHRDAALRRRSLVPGMAVAALVVVIVLACLLPWL